MAIRLPSWIGETLKRKAVRQLGLIYSSRMATAVLRFVAGVVVMRALGPALFGQLTLAAVMMAIYGRILEMGLTTTMVRKLSFHLSGGEEEKAFALFRRIYALRFMLSGSFVIVGWFLSPVLADHLFHDEALVTPLRLAALGGFIYNLWVHAEGALRSIERFRALAISNAATHIVRTGAILLLAAGAVMGVENVLLVNILQILLGFLIAALVLPKRFYTAPAEKKYPVREIFGYTRWLFLFTVLFMLFDRLDVLMLGYFRKAAEVGIYSVAFRLITPLELLPETFNTVFLPKVSRFRSRGEINRYFVDSLKVTGIVAVACVIVIVFARPLIGLILGEQYLPSVRLFQILVGAFVLLTMINPINLVGHTLNRPQLFAIMAGINLVLNFGGNIVFIPRYGALGAAIVTLVSRVLGGLIGLLILKHYLDRWTGPPAAETAGGAGVSPGDVPGSDGGEGAAPQGDGDPDSPDGGEEAR